MKKIILAIIVVVIVFAFTFPIYADQPASPGDAGRSISRKAQDYGGLGDEVSATATSGPGIYSQGLQAYLDTVGIPYQHTP